MAAYAGMIDRVDQELGRLFDDLGRAGELDNTLILFLSDNGACPYDRRSRGRDLEPYNPESGWSDSTGWAWARNTPFRYYKQNQFEGGVSTPAILHWPAGLKTEPGSLEDFPVHLVDVLPTVAELGGASIPSTWPGRDLSPLAGISLAPILAGKEIKDRPPIHLLFDRDRGLRDGDFKLVSFRSNPWELYNIARDRTELNNIAMQYPEIVSRMEKQWTDMAKNVLHSSARKYAPVASTATLPNVHREWTDFSSPDATEKKNATKRSSNKKGNGMRARIGTKLTVKEGQLLLHCSGDNPGVAFDALPLMSAAGPYTLEFRLKSQASGTGEIYWTTDAKTKLTKGGHLVFPVTHDGQWKTIRLNIPEVQRLYGLRLDPCAGAGEVRMEGLQLKDAEGEILKLWP